MEKLQSLDGWTGAKGPVVLLIMDGIGLGDGSERDLVRASHTPWLHWLEKHALSSRLKAHGKAVGMPSDGDMGNSEVGHNAIGCGRVYHQGAALVNEAIASRRLFEGSTWKEAIRQVRDRKSTLHFLGLLSDGNVHSHQNHLEALLSEAKAAGLRRVRVHVLLDGRDVPPTSALQYVERLESFLTTLTAEGNLDYRIASGGGRMNITMDRYGANWDMVRKGWETHVEGKARFFSSACEAIKTFRAETPGILDQDLPPFVIQVEGKPVGPVRDGDSFILFNFRGDRALEITNAFEKEDFAPFKRTVRPDVFYAGMMEYDGDEGVPKRYLVSPPSIDRTLGEYLARAKVPQLAISETQKFGHVTYFFNGNRTGYFDEAVEEYVEIPSDTVPFEERPWMKAAEITDRVVDAIAEGRHRFIRLNYPNGDMVGHTGHLAAVRIAVETVDLCVGRVVKAIQKSAGALIVSADHGNADDMIEADSKTGKPGVDSQTGQPKIKTAHSRNPVPVFVYTPGDEGHLEVRRDLEGTLGISSLAATALLLLGYEAPKGYTPSIVHVSKNKRGQPAEQTPGIS